MQHLKNFPIGREIMQPIIYHYFISPFFSFFTYLIQISLIHVKSLYSIFCKEHIPVYITAVHCCTWKILFPSPQGCSRGVWNLCPVHTTGNIRIYTTYSYLKKVELFSPERVE